MPYLGRKKQKSRKNIDNAGYRPNVGLIVCNHLGQLLWARRVHRDGWQFPQGGVEQRESPREAAYRELYEEVGLYPHQVRLLGTTERWYRYDVPMRSSLRRTGGFRGQKQRWFLFHLTGEETDICFDRCDKPEFDSWQWVDYWHPLDHIIDFKRDVYREALSELAPLINQTFSLKIEIR